MDFVGGGVGEEDFAVRGGGRPTGAFEAFGDEFPVFAGDEDFLRTRGAGACFGPSRASLSKDRPSPPASSRRSPHVLAVDGAELVVVAGKLQRFVHLLIDEEPVARRVFHVVRGGGEIRADRACFKLPHHRGKLMPAAKRDPTAARRIHAAEGLRPMPGRREGRDAAAAATDDAAVVAIWC
jgi:hypothetical protein